MTDKQIIIEDCPYFIGGNCQEYLDGVCENHKCDLKIIRELKQTLTEIKDFFKEECLICKENYINITGEICKECKYQDILKKINEVE